MTMELTTINNNMSAEKKVKSITTRKPNKEKIIDYLKENPKRIKTSDLAKTTGIDIKNISRYLKELESENSISRKIVQDGRIRVVYISLKTRKKSNTTRKNLIRTTNGIHTPERNKERLYDIYFKTDTIENLAKKYEIPEDYLNKLKNKFKKLKYPPRMEEDQLVCYQCGIENEKRLVFHHNHQTGELIALVCDSCNQKLDNDESVINSQSKKKALLPKKKDKIENPKQKSITQKRKAETINLVNGMIREIESFGRTIPFSEKQTIANDVFDHLKNLTKGIKYYLNAWEARYKRYSREKPENPLIDEYEDMQETLTFLNQLKLAKKELKNAKRK